MVKIAKGDILVRFAALSLLAVGLIGLSVVWTRSQLIGNDIRAGSAEAVAQTVVPQVEARLGQLDLAQPLSGPALEEFDAFVTSFLLSPETPLIRIRSAQGLVLYSSRPAEIGDPAGPEAELERAFRGETSARVGSLEPEPGVQAEALDVLRVFAPLAPTEGGSIVAALEVQQDYSGIAAKIADARRELYVGIAVGLAALYVVLQFSVWVATRAFSRAYARLSYLYRTGQQMRASLDVGDVLTQIARDATLLARGQYGLVALREEDDGGFMVKASYDHKQGVASQQYRKIDEWFLHRVTASGESLATSHAAQPYCAVFGDDEADGTVGLLGVPLGLRDKMIGVIVVVKFNRQHSFAAKDIRLVEELADQAAMAVEQANLLSKVRDYANELELSYDSTLKALMAALDTKDASTEGHSQRVAHLTVAIAREMGLPEERMSDIERGALLHDVGKIGVPDAVLRKPQALSRKEWKAMQKHPLLAGLLVSKVGILEGALPILLYHHERYDGEGYPFGLAGDKIPLEARIFTVVDAYDAMTSDRPYRQALSHEEAVSEIMANAGSQFDPVVTEAFKAVLDRMHEAPEEAKEAA